MRNHKFGLGLSLAAVLVLAPLSAFGGYKYTYTTTIDDVNKQAYGSLGSARNSANSVEYLGCTTAAVDGSATATCYAKNAAGVTRACQVTRSTELEMYEAVARLQSDGYLVFSWTTSGGTCTSINTRTYSFHEPKSL